MGAPSASSPVAVMDVSRLGWDELCSAESLQGLVNRRGPRLLLLHGADADRRWMDIYRERAGFRYETVSTLPELFARFRNDFRGLVVYDAAVDGSRYAAITMAGIEDLLPVSEETLTGRSPAMESGGAHASLADSGWPVVHDLRGRFHSSVEAAEWALKELMPRCSRTLAHAVDGGMADGIPTGVCGPMSGFDWQVMHRGFVFNLGAQAKTMVSYGAEVGGSAAQADLYERILKALKAPAQINGYGDPEEYWCLLLSRHGHYSFHAFHNWSFHSKVPTGKRGLRQSVRPSPQTVQPETDRYYVCFMTSEGDTMKGPLPFFYDSWFDPARGSVPVNWGVNPLMARLFPAMLEYFYATATPADGFFAGPSGAGYAYPDVMPDAVPFAKHTGQYGRMADIGCIDLWGAGRPDVLERYGRSSRPLGLTTYTSPARLWFLSDGTPVVHHELGYWQTYRLESAHWARAFDDPVVRAAAVERLKQRIERIAGRVRPPFVILVYGDLHSYARHASLYREVAAALDPNRFKPARLDEAMAGLRAWASDRVMVGSESVNERLAWATLEGGRTHLPLRLTNGRRTSTRVTIQTEMRRSPQQSVTLRGHERRDVDVITVGPDPMELPSWVTVAAAGHQERIAADIVRIPGSGIPEATCVGVYGSDYLGHPIGTAAADPGALRGVAWQIGAVDGVYQCGVSGPYTDMAAGEYVAAFRLKRLGDPPADANAKAVTLDVAAGGYAATGGVRGATVITADALPPDWTWRFVRFSWQGLPDLMETRVWTHGAVAFVVDRVAIFRLPDGQEKAAAPRT